MKNDGLFYAVIMGIFAIIAGGACWLVFNTSKVTETIVTPAKVVVVSDESVMLEADNTSRYKLYVDGGNVPKVNDTVNIRIKTLSGGGNTVSVDKYPNLVSKKPSKTNVIIMPTPGIS